MVNQPPTTCARGHIQHAGRWLRGWLPCTCPAARNGGHSSWTCRVCHELGDPEGTVYSERHVPEDPRV